MSYSPRRPLTSAEREILRAFTESVVPGPRGFESITVTVDAVFLDLLLEAARRHVTMGHHERCARAKVCTVEDCTQCTPCDCGFNQARETLKMKEEGK